MPGFARDTQREDDFATLDHYAILGVAADASPDDVHRAFRQQMAQYHPDRHIGASPEQRGYMERRSARIGEAYRALTKGGRGNDTNTQPRKHLEDLYQRASAHLAAGRTLQGAATLRQLLALAPQYRDAAELLVRAETDLEAQRRAARGGGLAGFAARFLKQRSVGESADEDQR